MSAFIEDVPISWVLKLTPKCRGVQISYPPPDPDNLYLKEALNQGVDLEAFGASTLSLLGPEIVDF